MLLPVIHKNNQITQINNNKKIDVLRKQLGIKPD